jgi:hypothetical protein
MPIIRIPASRDTTITNALKPDNKTRAVYANMGAADSLEVFSSYYSSSAGLQPQYSRALVDFNLPSFDEYKMPVSGSRFFLLKMYNVESPYPTPRKYMMDVGGVYSYWAEGVGLDLENYSDTGLSGSNYPPFTVETSDGANWMNRMLQTPGCKAWNTPGLGDGTDYDYLTDYYFDKGTEDLEADVTEAIEERIDDGSSYLGGFIVKMNHFYENSLAPGQAFYTKRFSARSSEYFFKRPVLEVQWETQFKDDRGDFYFISPLSSQTNNSQIFYYNRPFGDLEDIPGSNPNGIKVKIQDANGNIYANNLAVSRIALGSYAVSVGITGSVETELYDIWTSGSVAFYTGSFTAKVLSTKSAGTQSDYVFSIKNLQSSYSEDSIATFKIYSRKKDWSPNIYTVANKNIENYIHRNLYYKIFRIVDNLTVIDYSTVGCKYSLCSWDVEGNYFDLDMSMLEPGYMYGIKLATWDLTTLREFKEVFKFKVQ